MGDIIYQACFVDIPEGLFQIKEKRTPYELLRSG